MDSNRRILSWREWAGFPDDDEDPPMTDSQMDEIDERLRRYHEDDSQMKKPHKYSDRCTSEESSDDESEGSSSSGTTLAPDTPPSQRLSGEKGVEEVNGDLIVLDTPDRPGYVEPVLTPSSKQRLVRRRLRLQPQLATKNEAQNSQAKK